MQDLQTFNTIVLNQSGAPGDYPRLCDIYVSNDGLNWGNPVVTVSGMTEDEMRIRLPKVYSARYVKITQNRESNSGSWWAINEFSVDNVTYDGWFAAASSSGSGHNASNAVDNDPNSSWNSGAAQTGNEWFTVDLLKKTTFNIIILNQEGSEDDYPREYAVYGSEDGVTWPTRSLVTGNGTPGKETRIPFTRKWGYRYLKIAQTGQSEGSWWSIYNLSVEISTAITHPETNPLQIRYSEGKLKIINALPDSQLTIYSLSGQTVKQETNVTGTIEVNLPQGIYLVTVRDKYRVCTEKLIIK
ncbi:hypothetical protein FACS189440_19540 [Bacteroidia bacterium]|nr:hypothetical protein FACS189440_19540 [Bacteroidia bacterium]